MRYAVVGYGNLGRIRARVLGDRCVATVDPVAPDASHRAIGEVGPDTYDAVVIATPNDVKLGLVRELLGRGRSALVDKPFLFTADEGAALAAAASGGAVWVTSYNFRYEPLVVRAAELLSEGAIGALDRARLVYGNGTVRNWIGTWRETGSGVIEDLGVHLIDLAPRFGLAGDGLELLQARSVESGTFDYALFATADRRAIFEVANVFWKNIFALDFHGLEGSLHIRGLGKWGGGTLTWHRRAYPSGVPTTVVETFPAGDVTWEHDLREFEQSVRRGEHSLENDLRLSAAVGSLVAQVRR